MPFEYNSLSKYVKINARSEVVHLIGGDESTKCGGYAPAFSKALAFFDKVPAGHTVCGNCARCN